MKKRLISFILCLAMVFSLIEVSFPAKALSLTNYRAKYTDFINDSRFKNGASWGSGKEAVLTFDKWNTWECCAYAHDFAYYVYGIYSYSDWNAQLEYTSNPDSIKTGDIVYGNHGTYGEHWFVVLERNGNELYTAEGNCASKVCVSKSRYWIDGNQLRESDYGSSIQFNITEIHHFNIKDDEPTVPGVQQKINQILSVYPTGSYFTASGNACSSSNHTVINGEWCSGCYLYNIPSRGGLPSGSEVGFGADTCCSFATYAYYCIFGHNHLTQTDVKTSGAVLGDLVHTGTHWFIYLSEDNSNYYVYDANNSYGGSSGRYNGVIYNNYYPKNQVTSLKVYHATNYDEINGSGIVYTLKTGTYYIKNKATGKYLDVDNAADSDGTNIKVYDFNGSDAQKWHITKSTCTGNNTVAFGPLCSSTKLLNNYRDGGVQSGDNICLWHDTSDATQRWGLEAVSGGYYIIRSASNSNCVVDVNENGNVLTWTYHGGDSQLWELIDAETPGKPIVTSIAQAHNADLTDTITAGWNTTLNTTHYNIWVYKKGEDNEWTSYVHEFYVNSGFSFTAEPGEYRFMIRAYNSNYWMPDGSDWLYTQSDYYTFKVERTITGISVKTLPVKTEYFVGETPDFTGLTLIAAYNDGTAQPVTSGFTTSNVDTETAGTKTVTVTYEGKTATFDITVADTTVASGTCGANLSWTLDDTGTLTISGTGEMYDYDWRLYEEIPWYAVRDRIKSIVIVNGVTEIGRYAFYDCTSLTSVTIPDSVTAIGEGAFLNCTSLTSVTIGGGVTKIGNLAFCNCASLTSVSIPDSVTAIGSGSFERCTSLTSVTIPDSVTAIGEEAFRGCTKLTSVTIGGGVTTIGNYAFLDCTKLTSVTVVNDNKFYSSKDGVMFDKDKSTLIFYPKGKSGEYSIPDSVTAIWDYAFYGCTKLPSVTIGGGVTAIGDYAFYGCTSLTSVTIPDSVTAIGNRAFQGCTKLTSVSIPDSVTAISEYAFYGCTKLTNVTIGGGVTQIGEEAFCNCDSLTSITIPDSVTAIGYAAFYGCDSLTSVTIPDSVTAIGEYAFCNCTSLTSVTIPDSVTTIGGSAFRDCDSLTSVTIPDSVTAIGGSAFRDCTKLTSVTIGGGVTAIGECVFYGCTSLTSVTIPDSVAAIGDYAFFGCTSLTSVTIGGGVTEIGDSAFLYCSSLADIYYNGTEEEWNQITIDNNNDCLIYTTIHFEQPILEPTVSTIYIKTLPDKTTFFTGESVDLSGITITAAYSDGSTQTVTGGFTTSNVDTETAGTKTVTVTYEGKTATFTVKVINPVSENALRVSVGKARVKAGNTVDVAVKIENNTGFSNLSLEVGYDGSVMTLCNAASASLGCSFTTAQSYSANPYNMSWDSINNISFNGDIVVLTFEISEEAPDGEYPVTVDFYKGRTGDNVDGNDVNYDENDDPIEISYTDGAVTVYTYTPGDINGDEKINNKDATTLLRYLAGWELNDIVTDALDTNGDGKINNKDATTLLRYLAGWDVELY